MKRIFSLLLVAAMAMTAFNACEIESDGNEPDINTTPESLAGTNWSASFGIVTLSFTDETNCTMGMAGLNVDYTYTYADGQGTIEEGGYTVYTFTVNGKNLSLYNEQGELLYSFTKVDGNNPPPAGDALTNSTWVFNDQFGALGSEEMLLMFLPNSICSMSYFYMDENGEDFTNFECYGSYSMDGNSGTFSVTNSEDPTEKYQGSMTLEGETLTVNVMDRTFTMERFEVGKK